MPIHGPKILHTDEASFEVGRTMVALQRKIRDDLVEAQSDKKVERPVLGALVCLRALLEAIPDHDFVVHPDDVNDWRDQYVAWFKKNRGKMRKIKAAEKDKLLENALSEFDRVLKRAGSKTYRLDCG